MGKTMTPIISLAVVMALAMVAVFGSMSLASPAQAQDTPADTVTIYAGLNKIYDAGPLFAGVTKASGVDDGDIIAGQSPDGVLETSSLTNLGGADSDDDGKFALDDAGTFDAGVTMKAVTITFSLDHDSDTATDEIEKTVVVTVMPSMDASRATTGSGETTRWVDIGMMNTEGETAVADGTITGDGPGMVTLYTGDTMDVNVGKAFKSGEGTGKIMGFGVDLIDGVAASFTVEDGVEKGTGNAMVEAGPDGMVSLKAGEIDSPALTEANLTVTPYCAAADGMDTLAATCAASAVTVTAIVNVMNHTEAMKKGNITSKKVGISPEGTPVMVMGNFEDGNGSKGEIVTYTAISSNPEVLVAYYDEEHVNEDKSKGAVVLIGLAQGGALVTVTAIDSVDVDDPEQKFSVVVVPDAPAKPRDFASITAAGTKFDARSSKPGSGTRYDLRFFVPNEVDTLVDELEIELEDYSVPSSIRTASVAIEVTDKMGAGQDRSFAPNDVAVSGEKLIIYMGDMLTRDDTREDFIISAGSYVRVTLRQSAGIQNPTKAGDYGPVFKIAGGVLDEVHFDDDKKMYPGLTHMIQRVVSLSEEDGGLGDVVMATAKGFEKNVTVHFFLDRNMNGMLDSGEDTLCSVATTSGDNIGSCEFTVTTPTFGTGDNFINAVDGDGNYSQLDPTDDDHKFKLTASISATPAGGSPGEVMQVQLVSFPANKAVEEIKLSGSFICGGIPPGQSQKENCTSTTGAQGNTSLSVVIPNWAVGGVQELRVKAGGQSDTVNVTIAGPRIVSTPQTVVANQRISLVGTGFSPRSVIGDDDELAASGISDDKDDRSKMTIGGYIIDRSKINDGRDVVVDDGGNWSASVDLPLVSTTTTTGLSAIRVTDSMGRTGKIDVTIAERSFDVTPPEGRVGTLAVIRGMGYPGKNDEGASFTIDVIYNVQERTQTRVSVVPDASGRFEVQMRIPTTAAIPSTNQVEVVFRHEGTNGTQVRDTKQHMVPEGIISLSQTSGGPGSTVTLNGEGFKAFVPVESVKIGTIEITPAPKPNTDGNGMIDFDILIPGLDVGIQTVEVKVGGTTASVGFTVTESGVNPGDIKPVAEAVAPLGENLDVIWHFNNDSKTWTFYDGEEGSTLTHTITGETYLILVKSTQEAILNRDTRSLTCVSGNCWNQIVW